MSYSNYYFKDNIKVKHFDFDNTLLHKISYRNILTYDIS